MKDDCIIITFSLPHLYSLSLQKFGRMYFLSLGVKYSFFLTITFTVLYIQILHVYRQLPRYSCSTKLPMDRERVAEMTGVPQHRSVTALARFKIRKLLLCSRLRVTCYLLRCRNVPSLSLTAIVRAFPFVFVMADRSKNGRKVGFGI